MMLFCTQVFLQRNKYLVTDEIKVKIADKIASSIVSS